MKIRVRAHLKDGSTATTTTKEISTTSTRRHNKLSHTEETKRKRTQLKRNVSVNNELQPFFYS